MAVSTGQKSTESVARTLYVGVGAVNVLAVNPNKKELEKLYDRELDKEPEYVGVTKVDDKEYANVRISFVIKTVAEKNNGIETTTNHTFFLQKRYRQGSNSGKYQIIDSFGRTAWATREDIEAKRIPVYSNGPASISADYRPAYVGEEQLTLFIKKYLNIPNVQSYVNGAWVKNPKVDEKDCYVRLDHIEDYFKGNFKELVEILSYQPENIVKVPFGVRTSDDGKQYQSTYTDMCFNAAVTDYAKLDAEIEQRKSAGVSSLLSTAFKNEGEAVITDLHPYVVDPTTVNPTLAQAAAAAEMGESAPW